MQNRSKSGQQIVERTSSKRIDWIEVPGLDDCSESEDNGINILQDNEILNNGLIVDSYEFLLQQGV